MPMRHSKILKATWIRGRSNTGTDLRVFLVWFLFAVCVSSFTPCLVPASPLDGVFRYKLENRTVLPVGHYDLKFGLSQASGLPLIDGVNTRSGVTNSTFVEVDIDHDGDVDLIELSTAPRIQVWVNDGRGRFFPAVPNDFSLVRVWPFFYESAENDFLSMWLEPHELCLDSVTLGLVLREIPVVFLNVEDDTPRSPRAPPASMDKV